MKRFTLITTCLLLLLSMMGTDAFSCVGRVLTVAIDGSPDQAIMGQMLSVFINERTGTTIELKKAGSMKECFNMVRQGKADIFIGYIGEPMPDSGKKESGTSTDETYSLVKQYYRDKFGMVWLKPFGYSGPVGETGPAEGASLAAPVTTRKVLDRFPILDRVINKLSGKVDDAVMKQLILEGKKGDIQHLIKKFLKERNMI